MPAARLTFDAVRRIGLALPDVEEGTMYGTPALKLRGRLLACIPTNKSAEPDSLVVRTSFGARDGLLADAPETYYIKDHYLKYPVVLVRLSRISSDEMRDLLGSAHRLITGERRKKVRRSVKGA